VTVDRQAAPVPRVLLSVDIDGTLEVGDPPGPLPLALLRWSIADGRRLVR
jgi:hypothetical protein